MRLSGTLGGRGSLGETDRISHLWEIDNDYRGRIRKCRIECRLELPDSGSRGGGKLPRLSGDFVMDQLASSPKGLDELVIRRVVRLLISVS